MRDIDGTSSRVQDDSQEDRTENAHSTHATMPAHDVAYTPGSARPKLRVGHISPFPDPFPIGSAYAPTSRLHPDTTQLRPRIAEQRIVEEMQCNTGAEMENIYRYFEEDDMEKTYRDIQAEMEKIHRDREEKMECIMRSGTERMQLITGKKKQLDEAKFTHAKERGFVRWLAKELFKSISSLDADRRARARVSSILPGLLTEFASNIGAQTAVHRDTMAFVFKYNREIVKQFNDMSFRRLLDSFSLIKEGKMILNGPEFSIGIRDTPVHISRQNNIRRLKWISAQFILFWDERDKRGWLVNGTTAMLHIIRAFLSHSKKDNFKNAFRFKDEDLQEAEAPFMADSAIAVLLNPHNRLLRLYEEDDDDEEYLFKTQIDHVYYLLEKLIDHQADIARHHGSKFKNNPRRYLEGWDFEDVAKECPTIYPRVATIADAGKGWIDFIRAIHAVTLVGRGFGDIIKPADRDQCDSWATLPTNRYYIASCVSDLDRLLKEAGSHQDGHDLLCDNLIYHAPAAIDMFCQCKVMPAWRHCEPVRVLVPSEMSTDIPFEKLRPTSRDSGAVILGYNSHFPLIWGDTGPPQRGKLVETELLSKAIEEDVDSGFSSSSPLSEIESHSSAPSETEYSARPEELQPQTTMKQSPSITASTNRKTFARSQYTVGIICALAKELRAVRALFDNRHPNLSTISGDSNQYALGDMEGHWVVATCLPAGEYGTNSAASVASNLKCSFSSLRFCLLVGIGGGVPSEKRDIRLGDVVVSQPTGINSGVLQYDLGKEEDGAHFRLVGSLQRPPRVLTTAINFLQSDPEPPADRLRESLGKVIDCLPTYRHPGQELDVPAKATCASCNSWRWLLGSCSHIRPRNPRTTTIPSIHYGLIASGNRVIKDEKFRNRLARDHDILCFEMEAAGVINTVDCLVIRGICDYCDAQKNDVWQEYAAATAAAYAKLLLGVVAKVEDHGSAS
ncbi:hypothetical protein MKX08_007669 [Trichoderma sp. CBMAI-0020]|nr:hypothetical protein MKX08_007669 [Trichoderma sp. CBMAI-0020]